MLWRYKSVCVVLGAVELIFYNISSSFVQFSSQQIMSASAIIAGIPAQKQGLNYLVPTPWWNQFCQLNKSTQDLSLLNIPPLSMVDYADSFLLEFKDHLIEELEHKSNYLKFNHIKISLEVHKNLSYTPLNPTLWKIISKKNKDNNGVYTIIQKNKKIDFLNTVQIQIIYCSKNKSDAFVGYIPKSANLAYAVRQIGFQMGFIEVVRSKVSFLDRNPQISFQFQQMQQYTIQNAPGTSFMTFNMQRNDQQSPKDNFSFDRIANQSNEAVVGDLNTMEDDSNNHLLQPINNNRTMSTGAETPFSFALSEGFDLDREYRVKELFGAKQPEEIEEMRQLAFNKIQNEKQLISLPSNDEQKMQSYLDKLAEELMEGFMKKKTYKQKQLQEVAFN